MPVIGNRIVPTATILSVMTAQRMANNSTLASRTKPRRTTNNRPTEDRAIVALSPKADTQLELWRLDSAVSAIGTSATANRAGRMMYSRPASRVISSSSNVGGSRIWRLLLGMFTTPARAWSLFLPARSSAICGRVVGVGQGKAQSTLHPIYHICYALSITS